MNPRICRCCGGNILAEHASANPNLCVDCERWLEDDSPCRAATELLQERVEKQTATPEVSSEPELNHRDAPLPT